MIIFDVETTKLLEASPASLSKQPKITEIAMIKLDEESLEEIGRLHTFINPGEKLDPKITRITKITDEMLKDAPTFPQFYPSLVDFIFGEWTLVAHNITFDTSVLRYELERMEKSFNFPWPPHWVCTVEKTMDIKGKRMKQEDLYEHYFGEKFDGAHRAINDVEALVEIFKKMKDEGRVL